jgi:hypothetical protein
MKFYRQNKIFIDSNGKTSHSVAIIRTLTKFLPRTLKIMSTTNFCKKNASNYYAIELENDFDYDDLVLNLQCEFKTENNVNKWDNVNRNYEGKIISQLKKNLNNWHIVFDIIVRNGYYSGVNLDWDIMVENINDYTQYQYGDYQENELPKYVNNYINAKIKSIEKIFKQFSTPLYCKGVFSNGEAIYAKV